MASGKLVPIVVALATTVAVPAFAGGTAEQREACTPDAFRLCMSAMPDEGRVENCLRSAGPQLSPACHAVFYPPVVAEPMQTARGQIAPRAPLNARAQAPSLQPLPPPSSDDDD